MNILDFEKPIYDVENKIEELISNNKNGIFDEAIKKLQISRDEFRTRVFSELTA